MGVGHTEEPRPAARFGQWEARLVLRSPSLVEHNEQRTGERAEETRHQRQREERRRILQGRRTF